MNRYLVTRRAFLQKSSLAMAGLAAAGSLGSDLLAAGPTGVSIVVATGDPIAGSVPAQWAISQLQQALQGQGATVQILSSLSLAPAGDLVVVVSSTAASIAQQILASTGASVPMAPEALALVAGAVSGRSVLLASGNDARGLVYSVLELSDRVLYASSVSTAWTIAAPIIEQPSTVVRSIARFFTSEVEDKAWFNDQAFWAAYLSMLVAERINRFNLSFGLGYDSGSAALQVADAYFLFAYPFFVAAGGVSVSNLPATERDSNLAMLKFISDECARRGLDFQVGFWTSNCTYGAPNHVVQGLATTNGSSVHAAYCRDAVSAILTACPNITGVTFRVHSESGVPQDNFAFWQTVFSAFTPFVNAGRALEVDLHAKNCSQGYIDAAVASRATATVSPKKLAEHMGLPYHSAWIRASEQSGEADTTVIDGQASRYGYSNFLKETRNYGVIHRVWPGTQRVLLWGDPVFAAAYGRFAGFCGSRGMELCEPLSFKGREGSGVAGGRCGYSDTSLNPAYDYQKYLYTYRLWGRLLYNPDSDPETWRRYLVNQFGAAAQNIEDALASASRILMLVTTYHGASVANHNYWPEMYTNFSIVDGQPAFPDSNNPLRLASSFDPQLFLDIDPFAEALLGGNTAGQDKYFPTDFVQWLEDLASAASSSLTAAEGSVPNKSDPAFRRLDIDVAIQVGLGLFFARKFRSAVLWSIYRKTNDANAKTSALGMYSSAQQAWSDLASRASVYQSNVAYGSETSQHGHWTDRLPAITSDINAMTATTYTAVTAMTTHPGPAPSAISTALGRPSRPASGASHTAPQIFSPGSALTLALGTDASTTAAKLYYRHVNQADAWQSATMAPTATGFQATIPGSYTQTVYPLQYYFALTKGGAGALYPGFDSALANQPYFVVRSVSVSPPADGGAGGMTTGSSSGVTGGSSSGAAGGSSSGAAGGSSGGATGGGSSGASGSGASGTGGNAAGPDAGGARNANAPAPHAAGCACRAGAGGHGAFVSLLAGLGLLAVAARRRGRPPVD
jgi:hypothetical protein